MFYQHHQADKSRRTSVFLHYHPSENEPSTTNQVDLPQGSYHIGYVECPWSIDLNSVLPMRIETIGMYHHGPMQSMQRYHYALHQSSLYSLAYFFDGERTSLVDILQGQMLASSSIFAFPLVLMCPRPIYLVMQQFGI